MPYLDAPAAALVSVRYFSFIINYIHKAKENPMRHLLNPLDFSVEEIDSLLALARDIEHNLPKYAHVCAGKKLATLFYEPSTRTRLSFEAACLDFLPLTPAPPPRARALPTPYA